MQLSLIEHKISKAFLMLQVGDEPFSVNDIYNQFKGKSLKQNMGIVEVWELHNERIEKLIGKEITLVTNQKYLESQRHLKDYFRHQYKANRIIRKYQSGSDQVLPVTSNARFNGYLKEIADIVGIKKRLTHHVARRTFASTVLLFNNVPMEVVSELGHTKLATTQQSYGKIVQRKVGEEMNRVN